MDTLVFSKKTQSGKAALGDPPWHVIFFVWSNVKCRDTLWGARCRNFPKLVVVIVREVFPKFCLNSGLGIRVSCPDTVQLDWNHQIAIASWICFHGYCCFCNAWNAFRFLTSAFFIFPPLMARFQKCVRLKPPCNTFVTAHLKLISQ